MFNIKSPEELVEFAAIRTGHPVCTQVWQPGAATTTLSCNSGEEHRVIISNAISYIHNGL